jgi:prolipoprotein diacylglyceryltransferase
MEESRALVGFVLLVGGVVGARYAYVLAKWNEQLDSIGSARRWDEVEPATWKVTVALLVALFGFATGGFLFASALV